MKDTTSLTAEEEAELLTLLTRKKEAEASVVVASYLDGMDLLQVAKTYHIGTRRVQRILAEAGVAGELKRRAGAARQGLPSLFNVNQVGLVQTPSNLQWAYIAGFFDGEGSLTAKQPTGGTHRRFWLCINQNARTPLDWIQSITGVGSVYVQARGKHVYQLSGQKAVFDFLIGMVSHLVVKRTKAKDALDALAQSYGWEVPK